MRKAFVVLALLAVFLIASAPAAGLECGFENPEWRGGFDAGSLGADVEPDPVCAPDDPRVVGVSVLGANNAPDSMMVETSLSSFAVGKSDDTTLDGDYDIIHMDIEIQPVGEGSTYGPGDTDRRLFVPKTRGVDPDPGLIRQPSPVLRVEEENQIFISVENSNAVSHAVRFDGVNVRNDAVQGDEIRPGEAGSFILRPVEPGVFTYYSEKRDEDPRKGLAGMVVVEEDRPENQLQSYNVGGGKVRAPSVAVDEGYDAEYDLVYAESPEEDSDVLTLNGRTYPDTVRESLVVVEEGGEYRLNVANTASEAITLRTDAGALSVRDGDGYVETDQVELGPMEAERVRLEVDGIEGTEPFYVEGRDRYSTDAPTTFVTTQDALDADGLPDSPVENDGFLPSLPAVPVAALLGFVVGAAGFFTVAVVRRGGNR